jgi:hypothetical protein
MDFFIAVISRKEVHSYEPDLRDFRLAPGQVSLALIQGSEASFP